MRGAATEAKSAPTRASGPLTARPPFPAWLLAAVLVLGTVLAYQPVWHAGFIWDDESYVTQNALLTAPDGWSRIWFSTHRQSQYFPLAYTTLRLERSLWGLNPRGYHAVNVLLHGLNALLLWQLLRRLAAPGAWLAAAIFALHPVQVESVAWVTELKNVQSTLFYLLALWAWVTFAGRRGTARWWFYGLALCLHALALFSKTTACTLPAAMWLVLWWRREAVGWRRILQILPFVLLGVGMGLVSVWWEGHLGNYVPGSGVRFGMVEKALIASRAVWFYAAKLLWPVSLTFSYPRWQIDTGAPLQYAGLAGGVAVALLLWWRRQAWGRGLTAGVLFFVAALSPLLGFIPLYTFCFSFVADHYQYLACAGLIAPFAALLSNRKLSERLGGGLARCLPGGLVLLLGVLTWKQAHIYADEETLWRDTLAKNPACRLARNNLGIALSHNGQMDEAIGQFEQGLRLTPDDAELHNNLANALLKKGQSDEAIREYQEALRLSPDYALAHNNLGTTLSRKGRMDEAIRHFEEALRLKPDFAEAHNNLGDAFYQQNLMDMATTQYGEAIRVKPDYPEAHNNLGDALLRQGQMDAAIGQYREAIRLKPDYPEAHHNLGAALYQQGRTDEAISQYQEAIRLKPDFAEAHTSLGNALANRGQTDEAISQYQEAIRLKPDYAEPHNNLGTAFFQQGQMAAAISQYREAIRLKPDYADARYDLGITLFKEGQMDEAIHEFEETLRLKPDFAGAKSNLARALERKSKSNARTSDPAKH